MAERPSLDRHPFFHLHRLRLLLVFLALALVLALPSPSPSSAPPRRHGLLLIIPVTSSPPELGCPVLVPMPQRPAARPPVSMFPSILQTPSEQDSPRPSPTSASAPNVKHAEQTRRITVFLGFYLIHFGHPHIHRGCLFPTAY
ncbi:hypothetical protein BZA05DRAFT_392925 [Tricharina praecox]|uniref:uncharacterized protein n=1 Tax=Tricharina praecox TaxID=43433 RepID=UPI00221EC583|nr:uncharacterized protein BZA05DRAFT_392925 [Tricharina praecox]KAI5854910.1 hypothetical protein BZA05DRAFT_392925 [Tricharina praecox]